VDASDESLSTRKNDAYVYVHIRESDGSVFYVGKGTKRRAWDRRKRNPWWKSTVAKHGLGVAIVKDGMPEPCAFSLERALIRTYTGTLCNLTDGGEGTTGFKFNEVQLKRLSEAHIGQVSSKKGIPLNEQTKAKISAKLKGVKHPPERGRRKFSDEQKLELSNRSKGNTFRKGQKYSPEIIKKMVSVMTEKIGRPVIRYDFNYNILGEYASVSEASRETGIPAHSIYKAVTVKANQRKFIFKYKDESGYKKVILQRRVFKRQEIKVA